MITIRDYQASCRDAVLSAWGEKPWHNGAETFRSVLVNIPTSSGKTVIAGDIIRTVKDRGRCLFIADTDELCAQPRQKFMRLFKMPVAVEKAGERASKLMDVVIGSAQTLQREDRLAYYSPDHFGYVFVDEAHRGSDRNKKITDYFASAKVMGMTATAFRARLADLSDYYETVAFEMGMFDLVEDGYLAPIKVLTLPVVVDIRAVRQRMSAAAGGMDYDAVEMDTTIRPYYEEICRLVKEHAPNRHIIAYLPLIKSSQEFVEVAQGKPFNINARHVDGKSEDRTEVIEEFENGGIQLLSNSALLTTGWDAPICDCLLNLTPTRSIGLFRQKVGRIGRVLPGVIDGIEDKDERRAAIAQSAKPDALILDLLWQTERFGLQGPADLIAGNLEEKEALQVRLSRTTSARDLQEVSAEVQEERENALKQELIAAAERKKQLGGEALDLVAATLHSRNVTDFEPRMKWERLPVTDKQKAWMIKNGIDPDSAKNRGHVVAFMNLIFARKQAGLAPYRAVAALEKASIQGAIRFTAQHAYEVLQGNYPMSFGKHAMRTTPLRNIPFSYWRWCLEQDWFGKNFPIEYQFARRVVPEPTPNLFDCLEEEKRS